MANQQRIISVKADTKSAQAELDALNKKLQSLETEVLENELAVVQFQKQMANSAKVTPKMANKLKELNDKLKNSKDELKEVTLQTKLKEKAIKKDSDALESNAAATSLADQATGGLLGRFKQARLAALGFVKSLGLVKVALISSGIGAVVLLVTALTQAFKRSEEGQNMFSKGMTMIGAVVNVLLDRLADLGEAIIYVFTKPGDALKDFGGMIKSFVVDKIKGVIEGLGLMGGAISKLFKGDFKGALNDAKDGIVTLNKSMNPAVMLVDSLTESTKGLVKEMNEEAKIAGQIADQRAKADKIDRALILERAEASRKFNELRERAADKENVSIEDRIAALKEAGRIEEEITLKEIEAARIRFEAKQAENALGKSTKEDLDEEANLKAKLIDLETMRLKKQKTLTAEITTNLREAEAERKAIQAQKDAEAKVEADKEKARLEAIAAIQDEFKKKREDEAAEEEIQKIELEKERKLKELEDLEATESQKAAIIAYYDDKITQSKKNAKDEELKQDDIVRKAQINMAKQSFTNIAAALGENSKAGKAAAAAAALINTYQGITAELATKTVTPFEFVIKIANIATTAAIGFKSVKDILKTNPKNTSGSGSNPSTSARGGSTPTPAIPPAFNVVGASSNSQLASAIAEQEQQPVQAYVVSQDVTTAQSLENNIISGATLGG